MTWRPVLWETLDVWVKIGETFPSVRSSGVSWIQIKLQAKRFLSHDQHPPCGSIHRRSSIVVDAQRPQHLFPLLTHQVGLHATENWLINLNSQCKNPRNSSPLDTCAWTERWPATGLPATRSSRLDWQKSGEWNNIILRWCLAKTPLTKKAHSSQTLNLEQNSGRFRQGPLVDFRFSSILCLESLRSFLLNALQLPKGSPKMYSPIPKVVVLFWWIRSHYL